MNTDEFFKRYPYAVTGASFAESLITKPEAERLFLFSMFAFYLDQIEKLYKKTTIEDIFKAFYENESKMPPVNCSCKKGCSFCCHIQVVITKPEANIIIDYCRVNNIKIDYSYLEKQLKLTEEKPRAFFLFKMCFS